MTRIRRSTVFAGALAAGVAALLLNAPGAQAASATVIEAGWWTSQQGATAAPDGGFQVANGVDGPQSVAALRIRKDAGAGPVTLVLQPAANSVNEDAAAKLQACPITSDWVAANPGAMASAPKYDCTANVAITKDAAGTWSADVSALFATASEGQAVSLMIVPVGTPLFGGLELPFQLTFSGATVPEPAGAPAVAAPSGPSPAVTAGGGAIGTSRPSIAGGSPIRPSVGATGDTATAAPASTPPTQPSATTPTIRITAVGHGAGKPWGRLAYLIPLSALGGAGVVFARRLAQDRGMLEEAV